MGVGSSGSISTAGSGQLISTHVGSAGDCFTSATLVAGHHTTHTGLDASHGSGRGAHTHRRALTNGLNCRGSTVLAGLLKTCIGGAGDGLAAAGLVASHVLRTTRAGAAHHLVAVGDAETNFGCFGFGLRTTEGIHLLGTDVLITRHAVAGAELITGDLSRTAHHRAGHASAGESSGKAHLGGRTTFGQGI